METVSVVDRAPVGGTKGYLLHSGMGDCRMAWDRDRLVASQLAGTLYSPPIPLLARNGTSWSGVVVTPSGKTAGHATVALANEKLDVAGRQYETIKTVVNLVVGTDRAQLTTWFYPGLGILRQEQRNGPALTRSRYIEFVSGPS